MENRRTFIKLTGLAGGGLVLGSLVGCAPGDSARDDAQGAQNATDGLANNGPFTPNPYIQITADKISIFAPVPEIGQGARLSLIHISEPTRPY